MADRLFTCPRGTVLDLSKVCAVHPVTDDYDFFDATWTFEVRQEGGTSTHIGSDSKTDTEETYSQFMQAWKDFVSNVKA